MTDPKEELKPFSVPTIDELCRMKSTTNATASLVLAKYRPLIVTSLFPTIDLALTRYIIHQRYYEKFIVFLYQLTRIFNLTNNSLEQSAITEEFEIPIRLMSEATLFFISYKTVTQCIESYLTHYTIQPTSLTKPKETINQAKEINQYIEVTQEKIKHLQSFPWMQYIFLFLIQQIMSQYSQKTTTHQHDNFSDFLEYGSTYLLLALFIFPFNHLYIKHGLSNNKTNSETLCKQLDSLTDDYTKKKSAWIHIKSPDMQSNYYRFNTKDYIKYQRGALPAEYFLRFLYKYLSKIGFNIIKFNESFGIIVSRKKPLSEKENIKIISEFKKELQQEKLRYRKKQTIISEIKNQVSLFSGWQLPDDYIYWSHHRGVEKLVIYVPSQNEDQIPFAQFEKYFSSTYDMQSNYIIFPENIIQKDLKIFKEIQEELKRTLISKDSHAPKETKEAEISHAAQQEAAKSKAPKRKLKASSKNTACTITAAIKVKQVEKKFPLHAPFLPAKSHFAILDRNFLQASGLPENVQNKLLDIATVGRYGGTKNSGSSIVKLKKPRFISSLHGNIWVTHKMRDSNLDYRWYGTEQISDNGKHEIHFKQAIVLKHSWANRT